MTEQEDRSEIERIHAEYLSLCHAMQTGVAAEMNFHAQPTEPKHLRVGVNNALVSLGAICRLLLEKGCFTELEYVTMLRDEMQREVDDYTRRIQEHFGNGTTITLG